MQDTPYMEKKDLFVYLKVQLEGTTLNIANNTVYIVLHNALSFDDNNKKSVGFNLLVNKVILTRM